MSNTELRSECLEARELADDIMEMCNIIEQTACSDRPLTANMRATICSTTRGIKRRLQGFKREPLTAYRSAN